jgi:hypothetical protein
MVAWARVTRPLELRGLAILDLTTMGYALHLYLEWLPCTDPDRTWTALPSKTKVVVQAMFDVLTTVQVGNGARMLFWKDRWLQGHSIETSFTGLFATMNKWTRLVVEAMMDERWIRDISGSLSIPVLQQYIDLWSQMQGVQLAPSVDDN